MLYGDSVLVTGSADAHSFVIFIHFCPAAASIKCGLKRKKLKEFPRCFHIVIIVAFAPGPDDPAASKRCHRWRPHSPCDRTRRRRRRRPCPADDPRQHSLEVGRPPRRRSTVTCCNSPVPPLGRPTSSLPTDTQRTMRNFKASSSHWLLVVTHEYRSGDGSDFVRYVTPINQVQLSFVLDERSFRGFCSQ